MPIPMSRAFDATDRGGDLPPPPPHDLRGVFLSSPHDVDSVSVVTGVSHAMSQMERGKSPSPADKFHVTRVQNRPLIPQKVVVPKAPKKPFAGVSVTKLQGQISEAHLPVCSPLQFPSVPKANAKKSDSSPEFVSVFSGSGSSGNSNWSFPNSDEYVDPNSHPSRYPTDVSAPSGLVDSSPTLTKDPKFVGQGRFQKELDKLRILRKKYQFTSIF